MPYPVALGSKPPPSSSISNVSSELGIRVEVLPTDQAVRRFGESNPAGTAAALHLTC